VKKQLIVVDNFYTNPDEIREFALGAEYEEDLQWYKGLRSKKQYLFPGLKEEFEKILGLPITKWQEHSHNGKFQITQASDQIVYHHDQQSWAAIVYLTPSAPPQSGTYLYQSASGARRTSDPGIDTAFAGGFYDGTKFTKVDQVGNVYNRLVIFDAQCIHSAANYFGNSPETGRLIHLFFFD
jgi:hypothetical protein